MQWVGNEGENIFVTLKSELDGGSNTVAVLLKTSSQTFLAFFIYSHILNSHSLSLLCIGLTIYNSTSYIP